MIATKINATERHEENVHLVGDAVLSMNRCFEQCSVPSEGETVRYEDGFITPEAPIVPFSPGVDEELVSATRRVLDTAAEQVGRQIHWMRVYTGDAARERYGDPLPEETLEVFREFRLGILGSLSEERQDALALCSDLRRRLEITTAATRCASSEWHPLPIHGDDLDVTLFRDVSEDVAASLEYGPETDDAATLREILLQSSGSERVPDEPTGYSVSPISQSATEALVDVTLEYAFEHDRDTVTIAHQGDLRPGSEGSFIEWARDYLHAEYGDSVVDESTFRKEYRTFPDDEIVLFERRTEELCRELLVNASEYDTILAPALGGTYVAAVVGVAAGQTVETAELGLGDEQLVVSAHSSRHDRSGTNPIPLILAGCLLFDYLGWADAASVVRTTISGTLAEGLLPGELFRQSTGGEPMKAGEFADKIIDRIGSFSREPGSGGIKTTPGERAAIKEAIAALYNIVFEDSLASAEIELNQLLHEDEEADISLPEVGINFYYWRRWPVERRLEVLLHELAHIEEEPDEGDHSDEFYERVLDLTAIASDWSEELEDAFSEDINFDRVHRFIVESVHEETIEDSETVSKRKRWLRERLSLDNAGHY
jgi:isocitrate dehydrogenase